MRRVGFYSKSEDAITMFEPGSQSKDVYWVESGSQFPNLVHFSEYDDDDVIQTGLRQNFQNECVEEGTCLYFELKPSFELDDERIFVINITNGNHEYDKYYSDFIDFLIDSPRQKYDISHLPAGQRRKKECNRKKTNFNARKLIQQAALRIGDLAIDVEGDNIHVIRKKIKYKVSLPLPEGGTGDQRLSSNTTTSSVSGYTSSCGKKIQYLINIINHDGIHRHAEKTSTMIK